jgi:hypothetical protein
MYWGLYLLTAALAGACGYATFIRQRAIPFGGLLGGGTFGLLALQARNITIYANDLSTTTTVGSEPLQYLLLGVAVLHIAAAVLWYWGVYPPDDPAAQPREPSATGADSGAPLDQTEI